MRKYLLFLFSLLAWNVISHAADGTVLVIDKIAPKNGAFVGVVDSSQTLTNVTNFNNNLSASDNTVQKALDTLDNMTISGGGGGSSTLAVGTGTASNFTTNVTSPTAVISFLGTQFGSVANGTTNFMTIKNSGVTAGTYGSATQVSSVTIGADGRVTGAANVTISLTNSNLQAGTYSNVTVPAANVAAGSLGASVIASSIAASAVQDASIVGVSGSKITGTATIPNAAIDGSSVTKQGVLIAGTNITLTPAAGSLTISAASGGGGGSSALAVGTGTASNFTTNITSPTAVVSFLGTQFGSIANGTTNFISLKNSGVTAGTYGSATQVSSVTVGADGRVTGAANVTISLTNSNLQAGTYSNVTVPAANVAAGSLGASVIASSIAVNAVQDESIVGVSGTKITGTATIPNAAINGSSITKSGVLVAGTNITLTPGSGNTTISAASALPVGPNNSVQFSSFGALSGSSNLTFSPTDYTYTLGWSSGTYYTQKFSYSRFVDQFFDTKYVIDQIFLPRNDGGSYIAPTYFLYASTSSARNTPTATGNAYLSLYPDDGCAGANLSASGTSGAGATVSVNCFGGYFSDNSITAQIGLSEGVPYTLSAQPLNVWGDSTSGGVLLRDADGFSPNDGVELKAPSAVDSIAGLDNLVLVLPSTGGAIGDVLKITSVSSNEYSLEFGAVTGGGGGGGTTIWSKLDGSALDNAVSTINVTAPLTASSSPSGQINIGVLSSSVTLQGNTFNTGSNLVQLSGGLIPNSLISGSSVTKQGVITAGSGISVTNGSGIVTISATGSGITGTTTTISMTIDGQGSAIVAGSTRSITVPFQCVISSWSVVADASGSLAVHLASSTFNNYPTITNITGAGNGPSLSSQSKRGAAVSGWTQTTIDAGSVISFVVDSASTVKWATIVLWVIR